MFSYGRVYSKLPARFYKIFAGKAVGRKPLFLAKIYFKLFGYPDVACQMRYQVVEDILKPKKGEKILDAGCGNGIYLNEFADRFGTVGTGVDARNSRINDARRINNYLGFGNTFLVSELEKLDLRRIKFDMAICLEVLEHITDDEGALKRIAKYVPTGKKILVSVPIIGTALTKAQQKNPNFRPQKYEHVRSGYNISDIKRLAAYSGLKLVSIRKHFFLVSRYAVKFQQWLYRKNLVVLNLLLSPLLLLISELDGILKFYPRGYIIVFRKE